MVEPNIQYVKTADGVSIALWSIGEGVAVVNPPPALPWSHIQLEWQISEWRHWYEHLSEHGRMVRYDHRGAGLSERRGPFSFEGLLLDLEAVVDGLGLDQIALVGCFFAGPVAIAYAAKHPDKVSHLILWCSIANAETTGRTREQGEALARLLEVDYGLFTQTLANSVFGWTEGEAANRIAQYMQQGLTQEDALAYWKLCDELNVEHLLPQIRAKTLVLHRRDLALLDRDVARQLATAIPDARLVMLEGTALAPYLGDMETSFKVVHDFLADHPHQTVPHMHGDLRGHGARTAVFRTVFFTDIEGSTSLTQRLGDAKAQELIQLHDTLVRQGLEHYGGRLVKHTGDGMMASFPTVSAALEGAIAIQRAVEERIERQPDLPLRLRMGINAGEPVEEGEDLFGTAVQLARRICDRAQGGEVLVSDVVRQLAAGKGFLFADRGEAALRGFEEPVRVHELRWRAD